MAGTFFCDAVGGWEGVTYRRFGFAYDLRPIPVMLIASTGPRCVLLKRSVTHRMVREFRDFQPRKPALIQLFTENPTLAGTGQWEPEDHFSFEAAAVVQFSDELWDPPGGTLRHVLEVVELRGIEGVQASGTTLPGV